MWDFFCAFAGPIATIVASCVAVGVTGYFAWCQSSIADQQKEIAKDKLRFDLFDRRYKAFETIFPYYNALVGWKGTTEERDARTKFFLAYHQSRFLFGESIEAIFKELVDAGNKVVGFKENKELYRDDPEFALKSFKETQDILVHVFEDRLNRLRVEIYPFIDFSDPDFRTPSRRATYDG